MAGIYEGEHEIVHGVTGLLFEQSYTGCTRSRQGTSFLSQVKISSWLSLERGHKTYEPGTQGGSTSKGALTGKQKGIR